MLIGAHRGAYKDEPYVDENSLSAFKRAIDYKCDYIEFDVHKTLDNRFIVYHETTINQNGSSFKIKDSPWTNTLENLSLPITNEPLPLLEDVISLCKGKIRMNVEIKDPLIGKDVVDFTLSLGATPSDFFVSSFHEQALKSIQISYKEIYTGFLFIGNYWSSKGSKAAVNLSCKSINPYYRFLNKRLVNFALKHNLEIHTWTVNGIALKKVMQKEFVTSVITNDVMTALSLRDQIFV